MEDSKATSEASHPAAPSPSELVPHTETTPDVPDPDEDDLDDLDDLLDQFSANTISASGPGRPAPKSNISAPVISTTKDKPKDAVPLDDQFGEDFSAKLQKEMAALLGEIDDSPEMRQQLDMLMGEFTSSAKHTLEEADKHSGAAAELKREEISSSSTDAAFTDTIKKTMERMAASGQQASAAATSASNSEDDMLANLLKDFASGGGGGDGPEQEDFSKMLLGMMEQLTNKDVLYEPMKELHDKFPAWIRDNDDKCPVEDMTRYKEQHVLVREIVGRFEVAGYKDENPEDREYIVERMQKMQAAGNPPPDLVGNIQDTNNALGDIGNDCAQQ